MSVATRDDDLAYVTGAGIVETLDTMLVFNLLRTHSCLSPFIDADLRRHFLTSAQLNTLLVLRTAGDQGLQMSEIGRTLVVTKANVTGLVDRLERQGLVTRSVQQDRRAITVRLTTAGADLLDRAAPRHSELLADLTGCLDDGEKRTLISLLTKLRSEWRNRRKEDV
jgi:MarR family transcriptional regulator, 2-MHQ and catechol-resistance regulon repressor